MKSICLLFLAFLISACDLENRYPDPGEFCTPMKAIPECIKMDFRNKTLFINQEVVSLSMINRVQYEKKYPNLKLAVDVLSEHRIRIQYLTFPENILNKEEIYLRTKVPRTSIWSKFKKWKDTKEN